MSTQYLQKSGMSIIELLVYLSVLVLLAVTAVSAMISLNLVFERNKSERILTDTATTIGERLSRDIRDANQVNTVLSTLNATSSVLVLVNGATTTTYSVSNGALMLDVKGVSLGALTPYGTQVKKFSAVRYSTTKSDAVRVTLDLATTGSYASTTETFYIASVLRGSYEQ